MKIYDFKFPNRKAIQREKGLTAYYNYNHSIWDSGMFGQIVGPNCHYHRAMLLSALEVALCPRGLGAVQLS